MTNPAVFSEAVEGRYYNKDGCPVDAQDRHQPHRFTMRTVLNHPSLGTMVARAFEKRVPESHWEESVEQDGDRPVYLANVKCVCGTETLVELSSTRECQHGECPRWFWFSGAPGKRGRRAVFVAYKPDDEEQEPQTPAAS